MNPQKRPLRTAKFTDAEVRELRIRAEHEGIVVREEADRFGVTPETIRKILRGDTFRWVAEAGAAAGVRNAGAENAAAIARLDQAATESQERMKKLFLPEDSLAAEIAAAPIVAAKLVGVVAQAPWVAGLLEEPAEGTNNPLEES